MGAIVNILLTFNWPIHAWIPKIYLAFFAPKKTGDDSLHCEANGSRKHKPQYKWVEHVIRLFDLSSPDPEARNTGDIRG